MWRRTQGTTVSDDLIVFCYDKNKSIVSYENKKQDLNGRLEFCEARSLAYRLLQVLSRVTTMLLSPDKYGMQHVSVLPGSSIDAVFQLCVYLNPTGRCHPVIGYCTVCGHGLLKFWQYHENICDCVGIDGSV